MQLDTFIQLVRQLRINSMDDDTDPANILLQKYTNPYDQISFIDAVKIYKPPPSLTWGNGSYYTAKDSSGNNFNVPNCGWYWGSGGKWG